MRKLIFPAFASFLVLCMAGCVMSPAFAQAKPDPMPTLSASQQIALKAIHDAEQNLQQQWQQQEAQKSAIVIEFDQQHGKEGYKLNPVTLAVEKAEAPKAAQKPAVEPKK